MDNMFREPITGDECYDLWLNRIENAIQWRKSQVFGDNQWKRWYKLFAGDHWDNYLTTDVFYSATTPQERITVNLTLSIIEDTLAFLINTYPKFEAKPSTKEDILSAKIQPEILNALWQEKELNQVIIDCIKDAFIIGHGVAEVGYKFEIEETPKNIKKDGTFTYDDMVRVEEPTLRRVSPFCFIIDPDARNHDLSSARWCAEEILIPVNDVVNNKYYNNDAINLIKDTKDGVCFALQPENYKMLDIMFGVRPSPLVENRHVICYKVFDKKFRKYYLFAKGIQKPLIEETWAYDYLLDEGEGFPYEMYTCIKIPDQMYGVGLPYLIIDQQLEVDRNVTYMFLHKRNLSARKYLVREGLDPENYEKLINGSDGSVISVPSPSTDIQLLPVATISADVFNTNSMAENYIRQLTGSDQLMRGGSLPSRTTASEINARAGVAGLKIESKVAAVKVFICNIGYKMLSHIRNNMLTEKVIQLIGQQGNFWQTYTRDDLSSRITLKLDQISADRIDPMMDRQQALQTFQMITNLLPLLQQAQIPIDIGALITWLFDKLGQKDVVSFLPSTAILMGQPQINAQGQQGQQSVNPQSLAGLTQGQQQPTQPTQDLMGQLMGGVGGMQGSNLSL